MSRSQTAVVSKNIWGDQEYQKRAKEAFPILVRQALSRRPIFYQELADELGMPNPRNLNYPLGSVGQTLIELGDQWGKPIPPIQCLVINQADGIPGEGFGWFMPDDVDWKSLTKLQRRNLVEGVLQQIYAYTRWPEVLAALKIEPLLVDHSEVIAQAIRLGGGEGPEHRALKEYVGAHPELVGAAKRHAPGQIEKALPSGDSIDVFFEAGEEWVGVEVKPKNSGIADQTRGLFQCIKYEAVLRAMAVATQTPVDTRVVLVLGGRLHAELQVLKTMFGIDVIESVVPLQVGALDESA